MRPSCHAWKCSSSPSHSMRVHLLLVGVVRVARVVEEDVGVEVAPHELAGERAARALLGLAGAHAAEVQVGGEPRRLAVQPVAHVVVGRVVEGEHALAALGFAAALVAALARRRDLTDRQARRDGDLARGAVDLAPRQLGVRAPEGREDDVGLDLADVGDEVAGCAAWFDPDLLERFLDALVAGHRERADVGGEEHGRGVVLGGQLRQFLSRACRGAPRGSRRALGATGAGP